MQDAAINNGIKVLTEENFTTYRQVVSCPRQADVPAQLLGIHQTIVAGKFTGKVILECNMGGVRNITTEEVAKVSLDDDEEDS